MKEAGLKNVQVQTKSISSLDIDKETFFDVAYSFWPRILEEENDITLESLRNEFQENINDFFGLTTALIAIAESP